MDGNQRTCTSKDIMDVIKKGKKEKKQKEEEMQRALNNLTVENTYGEPPGSMYSPPQEKTNYRIPDLTYDTSSPLESNKRVGLVFDVRMLKHKSSRTLEYGYKHPERPERILRPLERLSDANVLDKLFVMEGREVTENDLLAIHTKAHIEKIASFAKEKMGALEEIQEKYNSIYLCPDTYESALISCGSTLSLVRTVVEGKLSSGFALVRPPGHHAEADSPCGFCFFNNIAVAARHAQAVARDLGYVTDERLYKVLILDWDIHHGNGTQHIFYDDPSVLYISLHRYDNGFFFPSTEEGNHDKVGEADGEGYNVNIAWSGSRMGNAEYLAAFEHIVMPIAEAFVPDLVLVSSGFDAAKGDPLGGYQVFHQMYGYMTHRLQNLANGKVVAVLEGGYNLTANSECVLSCVEALLQMPAGDMSPQTRNEGGEKIQRPQASLKHENPPTRKLPKSAGIECILHTLESMQPYWKCLEKHRDLIQKMKDDEKRAIAEKLSAGFEALELQEDIVGREESNDGKSHTYSTRAKTRSAQKNKNNLSVTVKSPADVRTQEKNESSSPSTLDKDSYNSGIKQPITESNVHIGSQKTYKDNTMEMGESNKTRDDPLNLKNLEDALPKLENVISSSPRNDTPDSSSSYYSLDGSGQSATPTLEKGICDSADSGNFVSLTSSEMDGSYLDVISHGGKVERSSAVAERGSQDELGACGGQVSNGGDEKEKKEVEMVLSAMGFTDTNGMSLKEMIALTQAGFPDDASGYTVPLDHCPHLAEHLSKDATSQLDFETTCLDCGNAGENWTCLHCSLVYCGRFVNGHMVDHNESSGHCIALSHSDLSVWCYHCDAYLNVYTIPGLAAVYRQAHILKHGTDLP